MADEYNRSRVTLCPSACIRLPKIDQNVVILQCAHQFLRAVFWHCSSKCCGLFQQKRRRGIHMSRHAIQADLRKQVTQPECAIFVSPGFPWVAVQPVDRDEIDVKPLFVRILERNAGISRYRSVRQHRGVDKVKSCTSSVTFGRVVLQSSEYQQILPCLKGNTVGNDIALTLTLAVEEDDG
jgi:hypothetical protein